MLVSVIVPIYNVENYLYKCLKSIQDQSLKDIEVILVNDGSTDGSFEIAENFSIADKRFKLYSKPNGGLGEARNYGLLKSSSDFVCFVDSDDFLETSYVELLYQSILSENSDIAICDYYDVSENIKIVHSKFLNLDGTTNHFITHVCAWNKIYRKSLFLNSNIKYSTGIWYEDFSTTIKLLSISNKISYVEKPLYNYISNRSNSIMNSISIKNLDLLEASIDLVSWNKNSKLIAQEMLEKLILLPLFETYIKSALLPLIEQLKFRKKLVFFLNKEFGDWKSNNYFRYKKPLVNALRKSIYVYFYFLTFFCLYSFFIKLLKSAIRKINSI